MKSCHQLSNVDNFNDNSPKVYAGWIKDKSIRAKSSSGGVFSALALEIIKEEGVIFAATMTEDLKVKHISVNNEQDLESLRGSKYLQSDIGETYAKVKFELNLGRQVLFVGTPCQVAGLKTYLSKKYENLLTVDFICHGVPSQEAFDIYCKRIGINSHETQKISFRYTEGWGFYTRKIVLNAKTNKIHKYSIPIAHDYYMRAFSKGLMFSKACYTCKYAKLERVSDITIADFWNLGNEVPFNYKQERGVSLVLGNSSKGIQFLKHIENLFLEERGIDEAIKGNYNLTHKSHCPDGRETYFEDSKNLSIKDLQKKYRIQPSLRDYLRPLKRKIMSFKIK